eukprot:12924453-Prorocentrum_lima.AAC.1
MPRSKHAEEALGLARKLIVKPLDLPKGMAVGVEPAVRATARRLIGRLPAASLERLVEGQVPDHWTA